MLLGACLGNGCHRIDGCMSMDRLAAQASNDVTQCMVRSLTMHVQTVV